MLAQRLQDATLLRQQAFFNGHWQGALNGEMLPVTNPSTGEVVCTIPALGAKETEQAIAFADAARKSWAKTPNAQRALLLEKWHQLILDNTDDLAAIMTAEQGKPLAEAKGEIRWRWSASPMCSPPLTGPCGGMPDRCARCGQYCRRAPL